MSDLARQLEDAEALAAMLKRKIAAATCAEVGKHDWKHIGGKSARCSPDCCCSVPVFECSRCGDCDYGDNNEARETLAKCQALGGSNDE